MSTSQAGPVTGGAAVVAALEACGVRHVFGIPGTHNLEIYRALAGSGIDHVVTRHEQGAGYAADGYARATGRPGVCVTTTGPGLTNIVTAAATAYADSVPLLVISPGVPRGMERADVGWLHEMKDQHAMAEAVFAASHRVDSAAEAAAAILETFAAWSVPGRHRPVHVEVPVDVLEGPWDGALPEAPAAPGVPVPAPADLDRAAALLAGPGSVAVLAGGGALDAADALRELAERLAAPVVTTVAAKGLLPEDHPLSLGASVRLPAAQAVLESAETLLVVGSEVADTDLWEHVLAPGGTVVRIDVDPAQAHKNVAAGVVLTGDAGPILVGLLARLGGGDREPAALGAVRAAIRDQALTDAGPLAGVQDALRAACPADVVVAGDSSQVSYYGTVHFWPMPEPRRFLYPTGYATLGYGLPAGIGAALATGRPVLVLLGDGAFTFSCQELMTAAALGLPVVVAVVDNGGFREIRDQMVDRGIPPLAVDLPRPDPVALARGFGVPGEPAADVADLAARVAAAFERGGPALVWLTLDDER